MKYLFTIDHLNLIEADILNSAAPKKIVSKQKQNTAAQSHRGERFEIKFLCVPESLCYAKYKDLRQFPKVHKLHNNLFHLNILQIKRPTSPAASSSYLSIHYPQTKNKNTSRSDIRMH